MFRIKNNSHEVRSILYGITKILKFKIRRFFSVLGLIMEFTPYKTFSTRIQISSPMKNLNSGTRCRNFFDLLWSNIRHSTKQEHLTQPCQNLKVQTTKVIHKSFVRNIFKEPMTKQRISANGLTPEQIGIYFNLAFSITIETKLTLFQYNPSHDIVFTKKQII